MLLNHVLANAIAAKTFRPVLVVSSPLALASILGLDLVGFATPALPKAANNCQWSHCGRDSQSELNSELILERVVSPS
jgi:hypothetical protein